MTFLKAALDERFRCVYLVGQTGIGKSTLALWLAQRMESTVYASSEMSVVELRKKTKRLRCSSAPMHVAHDLSRLGSTVRRVGPSLVVLDDCPFTLITWNCRTLFVRHRPRKAHAEHLVFTVERICDSNLLLVRSNQSPKDTFVFRETSRTFEELT